MSTLSSSRYHSALKNLRSISSGSLLVALTAIASMSFVACGSSPAPSDTSGAGGNNTGGAGVGGNGGMPPSQPQTLFEFELGEVPMKILRGGFEAPENVIGLTALVDTPNVDDVIGIARLCTPSGACVIYDYAVVGETYQFFIQKGAIAGSAVQSELPQAWPVQPGDWSIRVGTSSDTLASANVRYWYRQTVDGAFHGGAVDFNVFMLPGSMTEEYFKDVVDQVLADYAGLTLGNVNFLPLNPDFALIANVDTFHALLRSSAGVMGTPAVNLFVIQFGGAFSNFGGKVASIPGTPMIHGMNLSGLAYQPSGSREFDALILRHEIGHLAGLFHTTETGIEVTDPLSDTPECDLMTLQNAPETCPDVGNTMFPMALGATEFSPSQVRIIQSSMLYRGIFAEGDLPEPPLNVVAPEQQFKANATSVVERSDKPLPANPTPLERVLGGLWCDHAGGDYEALAIRAAGDAAPTALRAYALDEEQADILRARALAAYVRASAGEERKRALDLAEQFARGKDIRTNLRSAAFEALRRFEPSRARAVAAQFATSSNLILRELARQTPQSKPIGRQFK